MNPAQKDPGVDVVPGHATTRFVSSRQRSPGHEHAGLLSIARWRRKIVSWPESERSARLVDSPMEKYAGWSPAAIVVAERACARHGGWERFERLQRVSADVLALTGSVPSFMGMGSHYPAFGRVHVEPQDERVTFDDWPTQGDEALFSHGEVHLKEVFSSVGSRNHRRFLPRFTWRPVDAAYFFGYALVNYLALPFLLARTRLVSCSGRHLVVDFPEGFDTHCKRQSFHFDESGLLVAHDYTADVISGLARGRHFSSDYVEVSGLWFARSRRIVARLGPWATPIAVLEAKLDHFAVTLT